MAVGIMEIVVILLIILILFGAKRIPEVARSLGRAIAEFKKGMNELSQEGNGSEKRKGKRKNKE